MEPVPAQLKPQQRGEDHPRVRVAIVGTGLAGLTTAFLLQSDERKRYEVTLFEQAADLSFDSASVTVKNGRTGIVERIDLPMRALAGGYYANLLRMYRYLRIPMHATRFLYAFVDAGSSESAPASERARMLGSLRAGTVPGTYFVHASNLHKMPLPWPSNRSWVSHLMEILYLIVCHIWFTVACFFIPTKPTKEGQLGESFDTYARRIRLPRRYVTHYVLPLMSMVSTCSHDELLSFPASDIINYRTKSHGEQHYTVCGGVGQVQSKLTAGLDSFRLNARVLEVVELEKGGAAVRWQPTTQASGTKEERFDRVVLAVSPDVAASIFKPLIHPLSRIPTRIVESSVLPGEQSQVRIEGKGPAPKQTICSHCVGKPAGAGPAEILTFRTRISKSNSQTESLHTMPNGVIIMTSPLDGLDSNTTLKAAKFTRTLRSPESRAVVENILNNSRHRNDGWVNGKHNVWVVGSWCWDGMVLLEGCVVSAMRIAQDFGVGIPWEEEHN